MRILYLLKKGLQHYPPCLSQVMMLNDLGADLIVYHGKNSDKVNSILDARGIKHVEFSTDKNSRNRIESAVNFVNFSRELRRQFAIEKGDVVWFGNVETLLAFDLKQLKNNDFVTSVLELYNQGTIYDRKLKNVLNHSLINICCERHRAAIMESRYSLKETPYVLVNKPYEFQESIELRDNYTQTINKHKEKFVIVYQGVIAKDRPLDTIAKALAEINNKDIVFYILGKHDTNYEKYLKSIYPEIEFFGYVPAPEHLAITSHCNVGIANYNVRNLNNVFCAPNKIYEYAKYGLPMLCSKNIGLTETVGAFKAGECIDFNNTAEIVNAITKIRNNYKTYSDAAYSLYTQTDNTGAMEEIYDRLIQNS